MSGESSASLVVQELRTGYGPVVVLRDVSLEVRPGELVALVGANGAGKSTLLKAISGLLRPWSGSIQLGSQRLDQLAPSAVVRLGVAHVPERRQVFGELSVRDNLVLGGYTLRLDPAATEQRIQEVCRSFPVLLQRLGEPAGNLSGGQQQMLAIARGLMLRPRVLLLDEPSLGLAPLLVEEIFQVLGSLRETGAAILLVEQNARMSLAIADRAYVLERGRVVLSGTGPELLASPRIADLYLGGGVAEAGEERNERIQTFASRLQQILSTPVHR